MASAVSSIYGYVISAASAAYAPTNGTDVSAIASAYAEQKLDASASSSFYPSDNPSGFLTGVDLSDYATTAYVDSSISGKLDSSSQVVTSIGVAAGALSSINNYGLSAGTANSAGTALYDSAGRTLTSMVTKAEASSIANGYASGKLDTSAFSSVSGTFLTSVDLTPYQTTADMSGYLQTSESANYYPTSNPSGFITGVNLSDYATTAYVDSSVSSKLDTTAFSTVSSTFLTSVDLSDYATTAYVDSSVSGKLDSTAFDPNAFYPSGNPSGFLTGVDLSDYATKEYVDSSVSSKLDTTAFNSGDFYSTSNPSGFLTAVDLSPYQTTAGMTAYLGTAESANYYPTSNPSGFITAAYSPTFAYSGTAISSIDGSAVYDVSAQDGITALSAEIGDINTILQSI